MSWLPGLQRAAPRRGEAILTMAATMPKVGSSPWAWIVLEGGAGLLDLVGIGLAHGTLFLRFSRLFFASALFSATMALPFASRAAPRSFSSGVISPAAAL